jgi:hypothetical protein
MDQIIAWGFVVAMVVSSFRVKPERYTEGFVLTGIGVLAALGQLGINAIVAPMVRLTPPTIGDVLWLRELRSTTGLLIVGYGCALSGLLVVLRLFWSRLRNGDSESA